jgi:hypothetical protein
MKVSDPLLWVKCKVAIMESIFSKEYSEGFFRDCDAFFPSGEVRDGEQYLS